MAFLSRVEIFFCVQNFSQKASQIVSIRTVILLYGGEREGCRRQGRGGGNVCGWGVRWDTGFKIQSIHPSFSPPRLGVGRQTH